jgi:hypothetical protein
MAAGMAWVEALCSTCSLAVLHCAAFLPTLEKFGKSCQALISPESFILVQTPIEADGAQVAVRFQCVSASAGQLLLQLLLCQLAARRN